MDNRQNLLNQAQSLFAARGYDAVGVQEIADAAGIGKPTLYHYFGSKQGLLDALLNERLAPFFGELHQAAVYRHDLVMTLRAITTAYFSFASQNPLFYRFFLSLWFAPAEPEAFKAAAALNSRQQDTMEGLFALAAEDHGNMRGRQHAYAASFLGLLNTYIMLGLNGYSALNDALVQAMLHQFMHGIFS